MALNPEIEFPGQVVPSSPEYPFGSARDITAPGDLTATPFTAAMVNDIFGFQQALLDAAGITPTNVPDKVTLSQYLNSLRQILAEYSGTVFTDITTLVLGTALDGSTVDFQKLADKRTMVRTRWRDAGQLDGSFYIIWNEAAYITSFGSAPDGLQDFHVGGGTSFVAQMSNDAAARYRIGAEALIGSAAKRDAVYVGRKVEGLTDNHAFADRTIIDNVTDAGTYGAFDSAVTVQGSHTQNHQFSFQDRAIYNGSGFITTWAGLIVWPTAPGSGTVTTRYGMWFKDVDQMGGGGTIDTHIGLFLEDLNNATSNVAISLEQTVGFSMFAPNAGKWQIGGNFAVTALSSFGTLVPIAGVPITFTRGNIGDEKGFLTGDTAGATLGVSGDFQIKFVSNAATRFVMEDSAELHAFRPVSQTQNLGTVAVPWGKTITNEVRMGPINDAIWTCDTGTPEGAVTAPPGSLYTDRAGGAGATLFVKESGTGDTGWVAK